MAMTIGRDLRFEFDFEPALRPAAALFGVTPRTAHVDVDDLHLRIRFGPWQLTTPVSNIADAHVTGPYSFLKVAGPPHLSFADRGLTFATNRQAGVCLTFRRPVPALLPFGLLKHPAVTVTVEDPQSFSSTMTSR